MQVRASALAVALLVILASAPVLAAPIPSTLPHAGIVIASDADFTSSNGVVAGVGTPANPFLISGWRIVVNAGAAISVTNTTAAFVIANNILEGPTGVSITADASWAVVQNNQISVRGTGVYVSTASPSISGNTLQPSGQLSPSATAIFAFQSSAQINANAITEISTGIYASQGSMSICGNDIQMANTAISLLSTVNATLCGNTVTRCNQYGIYMGATVGSVVSNNTIQACLRGIYILHDKDVNITANVLVMSTMYGLLCEQCSGTVALNTAIDSNGDGIDLWKSPALYVGNNVSNNLGSGFFSEGSSATLRANVASRNGVGIHMSNADVLHLDGNVMTNNTVGIDLPYDSRQTIPSMSGNFVNGVNVDGTISASDKVFFYKAANVTIAGGVRDSGFSAGYFGSLTAEGNVVLYEVDTATIQGTLIGHADVGVMLVNSFNVVVRDSTIVQTQVGVVAYGSGTTTSGYGGVGEVPACVVSVKNTTISIPVDPVGTVGIEAEACRLQVFNSTVSTVATGIVVDGGSQALILNTSVHDTTVGLDLDGTPNDINVTGSAVFHNKVGILARGTIGTFVNDTVTDNTGPGMALLSGAQVQVMGSSFLRNGAGLVDTQACGNPLSCSQVIARGNLFAQNVGAGVAVNGTTSFQGDQFLGNGASGAQLGTTTLRGVVATGNALDGLDATGTFVLRDSTFNNNGKHGAYLAGSGDLRNSTFNWNLQAGIRASPAGIEGNDLDISHNFDGILLDGASTSAGTATPTVPALSVQGVWGLLNAVGVTGAPSLLDIHRSSLVANERDAIRAGTQVVNATSNWFGHANGPAVSIGDQVGAYRDGVSPGVRFIPYYTDAGMTTTGPVPLL